MNPALLIKLAPYAILAALLAFAGYKIYGYGEAHVQAQFDAYMLVQQKAVIIQQAQNQALLQAEIDKRTKAENDNVTNQAIIDSLSSHINSLPNIHIPVSRCAVSGNSTAGAGADEASRILSDRVDGLVKQFQDGTTSLIQQCSEINKDAIRLNAQIK